MWTVVVVGVADVAVHVTREGHVGDSTPRRSSPSHQEMEHRRQAPPRLATVWRPPVHAIVADSTLSPLEMPPATLYQDLSLLPPNLIPRVHCDQPGGAVPCVSGVAARPHTRYQHRTPPGSLSSLNRADF